MSDAKTSGAAAAPDKPEKKEGLLETVKVILGALLIALGVRTVLAEPFNIPSESMLPTLMVGDYLFVSKYAYGYSRHSMIFSPPLFDGRLLADAPKRGDIVVFKLPRDNKTDYIKRVIGLPGDRVQMRNGRLFLNGEPVGRRRVANFVIPESPNTRCAYNYRVIHDDGEAYCHYPQFEETLPNGVSYNTLDLTPKGANDDTRVYTVPDGHYFVMGDNRDNSQDSRRPQSTGVGFVPFDNLVGRAEIIFFSTDGGAALYEPWYWVQSARFDRIFDTLR